VTVPNINGRAQARGPSGLGFAKANNSSPLKASIVQNDSFETLSFAHTVYM
jgi:hypothetical protein